ncbi:MAG: EAL domain-containing protein [Spongiibacteraceae bacterium]
MSGKDTCKAALKQLFYSAHRVTESSVMFPLFAAAMMIILWATTINLIQVERRNAEENALALTRELTDTYEAQVVRVLREITQNFKVIQFAYDQQDQGLQQQQGLLSTLDLYELLPPAFLFTVAIVDTQGDVVASTEDSTLPINPALFQRHQQGEPLLINSVKPQTGTEPFALQFSHRIDGPDGRFAGVSIIDVDAAFFVSSYDSAKMGAQGLLGLVGTDGNIKVVRQGDDITSQQALDYQRLMSGMDSFETKAIIAASPIDGELSYLSARELYGFSLAVIVGLSQEEQLKVAEKYAETYLWRATGANLLLVLIIGLLWRMSYNLAKIRRQETQARIVHAEQIEYLAYHDSLTGLPNRSLFNKLLSQNISLAQRNGKKLAMLFLDLDHFKYINDTLGHDAGDQLLQQVAERLKNCLRDSDTVARLGGDEFVVMLPELDENAFALTVAQKIVSSVARPFILSGQESGVTASIGISIYPDDGLDEQTLTKSADIAMYKVKEESKNNFQLYSAELHEESLERLTLESSLRHALENKELELFYQAKRDVVSGKVTGMEALLRWQHPDLGMVAPLRFLQVAEDIGLLIPIGNWVLKTVCEQNVSWQQQGLPQLNMAVNLTSKQFFHENLSTSIVTVLKETGMDANLLELEISEHVLMQNVEKALIVLNNLKQIGIRIAIDNFGVGYSSLAMLKQFPLDAIKIDRTFIRDIADAGVDKTLAQAIVTMGKSLGLTVVAQGVETQEQADFLKRNSCDEVQGFYFNKPMPAAEFSALFKSTHIIG